MSEATAGPSTQPSNGTEPKATARRRRAYPEEEGAFSRLQERTQIQLGFVNSLLTTLAIGLLAFAVNASASSVELNRLGWRKWLLFSGLVTLALSPLRPQVGPQPTGLAAHHDPRRSAAPGARPAESWFRRAACSSGQISAGGRGVPRPAGTARLPPVPPAPRWAPVCLRGQTVASPRREFPGPGKGTLTSVVPNSWRLIIFISREHFASPR